MVCYNDELTSGLLLAVEYGDPEIVEQLVKYMDPNTREPRRGRTALQLAVRKNYNKIAKMLVHYGADVNAVSDDLLTPLHIAVGNQSAWMVRMLLFFKANANPPKNLVGKTLLYMAVEYDSLEITEMLLRAGASIQDAKTPSTTVFDVAARKGDHQLLGLLFYFKKMREFSNVIETCIPQKTVEEIKLLDSKTKSTEKDNQDLEMLRSNAVSMVRENFIKSGFLSEENCIKSV